MAGRAPKSEVRSSRRRFLGKDNTGQVSFAMMAVVLMVATAVTGTYLARQELDRAEEQKRERILGAMEKAIEDVAQELSLCAASRAQALISTWTEYPVNESKISDRFSREMASYIVSAFPRIDGAFTLSVENWTGGLFFIERKTLDLVPVEDTTKAELEMDGSKMGYARLPSPSVEEIGETSVSPYYIALGNFSARVNNGNIEISRQSSFQRPIISALPFLESKLRAFESASAGEFSDLGRLVEYMLSSLCELRVLEGYGQPMYAAGKETSQLLTEIDVYRAIAVGLVLEQVRLFRAVDASFSSEVSAICGGGYPGNVALLSSKGRQLDPAELFLWFLGKTDVNLDPRMIVAQAVFGLSDQLVIKLMEYMGWLGEFELAKAVLDKVTDTVDSVVAYLTGEDKALAAVRQWLVRSLQMADADPTYFSTLFSPEKDYSVWVPERVYYVEDVSGNLYPVWVGNASEPVDVPQYDLLASEAWKEFYPVFKESQTRLRELLTDGVTRLAFDLASAARFDIEGYAVDPTDEIDLFTALALGSGNVSIDFDPDAFAGATKDLPMFSTQYDIATSFCEFIANKTTSLYDRRGLMDSIHSSLSASILASARYAHIPDLIVPVEQQLKEIVRNDVEFDAGWGVGTTASMSLDRLFGTYLQCLSITVNSSIAKADDGFAGPMVDSIASVIALGADDFPGIGRAVEDQLTAFATAVLSHGAFAGHKKSLHADMRGDFEFWEGDLTAARDNGRVTTETVSVTVPDGMPDLCTVPYDASRGYTDLNGMFPTGNMLVQLRRPWDFDRAQADYPNIHLTSLSSFSAVPYATQWTASASGLIELRLRTNDSAFQSVLADNDTESRTQVKIELSIPVVVHSAWPLEGVDYNPSNNALMDSIAAAKKFFEIVWNKAEPVLGWVKDALESIYRFSEQLFAIVTSFATRVIKVLSVALQVVVETLQEYIQKFADSAIARALKVFLDISGRVEFRVAVHGFIIIVQTYVPDLVYRRGNDLLRIIVCTDRFGPGISFGVRFARLSDGSWDVLANGTVALRNVTIDVAVDPLMHILRRFVEAHAVAQTWVLDLVMPEVETYELLEVSTSDIPGLGAALSNIPIPVLGLSACVEAGMAMKYSPPFPTDVVINEFESNPQGDDAGGEWVELYNPLGEPRSVDGWKLTAVHGKTAALDLKGAIPANGLLVFTFPEASIDNGYAGDPFNDGDAVVLVDAAGVTVDVTPVLRDVENDGRTNQRSWDGGPRWVFGQGSMGTSNGAPVLLATSDFIAKALFEAFREAFVETSLSEVHASLDFLILFSKRVLHNFIENLLSLVREIIHEVIFYIEVTLNDASGFVGAGFRTSFVVSGTAITDLIRWLIHTFATFVVNLGRPSNPIAYPAFPKAFFSGLYIGFEVLARAGVPNMVRLIGAVGDLSTEYAYVISVSPNLPALGRLAGRDWGNWSVDFGVYLEGVPRAFATGFLAKDTGDLIDFWIVRARLRGL
ncbi:MAG: lamin tail domain-containing protein [Thermoplasmata archaeon]